MENQIKFKAAFFRKFQENGRCESRNPLVCLVFKGLTGF